MNKHSHMKWSWILMIAFFTLSIIDMRFGILGFICMLPPILHAVKGDGKVHCAKHCPRASFLSRFLKSISFNRNTPKFLLTKKFKNGLLVFMILMFGFSIAHSGGDLHKLAFAMFRFMAISSLVSVFMGIAFKPRSWCAVCPMGHGTVLIDQQVKKRNPKVVFNTK